VKQQDEDKTKLATLQRKVYAAQIDVNYTIYYPLTEKYLSLYPQEKKREIVEGHNQKVNKSDDDKNDESGDEDMMQTSEDDKPAEKEEEKPPMWTIIKKCMADKTLDKLRDGKLDIGFDGKPIRSSEGMLTDKVVRSTTSKERAETTGATTKKEEKKRKKKEVEVEQPEKEEEDSDGGFFED